MTADGMIVAPPRTSIVTTDEWMVLAALAAAQRQEAALRFSPELGQMLMRCAASLTQAHLRLPLPDVARSALEYTGWLLPSPKPDDSDKSQPMPAAPAQPSSLPREGSLRRRAVEAARGKAVITARELRALAISRQHLSHLCTLGLFERIAPGQYRLVIRPAT